MTLLTTVGVLMVLASASSTAAIPKFITTCNRKDPDMPNCVIGIVTRLRPYLAAGIPEFRIPPLEPLHLRELVAVEGPGIKISAKEIDTYGCSDFTIKRLKLDMDNLYAEADVDLPHLFMDGLYSVEGRVLTIPVTARGTLRGNFTKCIGYLKMRGEFVKDEMGEDHLHCTYFDVKISVGNGHLRLENLFGTEELLGDLVNQVINSNFDTIMNELTPAIEKTLSAAFKRTANNIVEPFTYRQLFPDGERDTSG
ncbi:circadian clock-controlled protein daywake-like [Neodiprion virginianus]|uniref:circadian clock-controlled protein daywake-like n=1 Tax=Neodiprion fabricii TaxID=2872261 RepID=UPI001ED8F895|nr:circadian clock-controlled protein daywake-like [Neodiprion fabricii]XP_046616319.1 circadian clock-controlled protein daywake-like [Neodiprion virginianus]